jgi:hypothetical protein
VEEHVVRASVTQSLNVGVDLRRKLELVAREQGTDGTYLGRKVLREYVEREEALTGVSVDRRAIASWQRTKRSPGRKRQVWEESRLGRQVEQSKTIPRPHRTD